MSLKSWTVLSIKTVQKQKKLKFESGSEKYILERYTKQNSIRNKQNFEYTKCRKHPTQSAS
jgi:hypothetical protein